MDLAAKGRRKKAILGAAHVVTVGSVTWYSLKKAVKEDEDRAVAQKKK